MKCPVLLYVYSKCCWNLIFKGFYSSVVSTQDCVSIGCATRRFDIPVPDRVVTPLSLTINCLSPCKLTTMSAAPPLPSAHSPHSSPSGGHTLGLCPRACWGSPRVLAAAPFPGAQRQQPGVCGQVSGCRGGVRGAVECDSAPTKKDAVPFATVRVGREGIMLRE